MRIARRSRVLPLCAAITACAHGNLENADTHGAPEESRITPEELIARANANVAGAPPRSPFVAFIDRRPTHCEGPLCWEIENGHAQPVQMSINGEPVHVVGPMGAFVPPYRRAYVRLAKPGRYTLTYELHDAVRAHVDAPLQPLPTVLSHCHLQADLGWATDASWGGHSTHLDHTFCY